MQALVKAEPAAFAELEAAGATHTLVSISSTPLEAMSYRQSPGLSSAPGAKA
jgi:hypothetical protein